MADVQTPDTQALSKSFKIKTLTSTVLPATRPWLPHAQPSVESLVQNPDAVQKPTHSEKEQERGSESGDLPGQGFQVVV